MAVIPYQYQVEYDRRLMPGETQAGLLAEYQRSRGDLPGWEVMVGEVSYQTYTVRSLHMQDFHPAWLMDERSAWVKEAAAALEAARIDPRPYAVPYCTNGSVAAVEMGLPTLIFGPSDISLAHKPNETIRVDELFRGVQGYQALAVGLTEAM